MKYNFKKVFLPVILLACMNAYCGDVVHANHKKSQTQKRAEKKLENITYYLDGSAAGVFDEDSRERIAKKGFRAYLETYLQDADIPIIKGMNRAVEWVDRNVQLSTGNFHLKPLYAEGAGATLEYRLRRGKIRVKQSFNGDYGFELSFKHRKSIHSRFGIEFKDGNIETVARFRYSW